jgi:hypothetical protein
MSRQRPRPIVLLVLTALAGAASVCSAQTNILSPGDFVLAIDRDFTVVSSFPAAENPPKVIDGLLSTKYLNFGKIGTGFIVTPSAASIVQSFILGTANDAPERDPASYQLFGTNSAVTDVDNSAGNSQPWTLISSGSLTLPDTRQTLAASVDFANSTSYSAYKMIFPTVKNAGSANSMQLAEAQFYTAPAGGGSPILSSGNAIIAVANARSQSSYPGAENPPKAVDGNKTAASKYLNFGRENSGLIITPAIGATTVHGLRITTANDVPGRDPSTYELYGTNNTITDGDNSVGDGEAWTLISSGALNLPGDPAIDTDQRNVEGPVISFANSTAYTSYKIVFPENKGPDGGAVDSIQFAELELFSVVPEPGSIALLGAGLTSLAFRRRRRA